MQKEKLKIGSISFSSMLRGEAKSASVYTFSTFITRLWRFLLVPLFWKKLSPADYGLITVTDIAGMIVSIVIGLCLNTSITRFYYEWTVEERKSKIGIIWMMNWFSHIILGVPFIYLFSLVTHILFPDITFYPFVFMGLIAILFT